LNESVTPIDCIFCKIVRGEMPAHKVYENERILVFMDIFPVADGHTLLIPKVHGSNLLDTPVEDLECVMAQSRRVAHALRDVFTPDGIGVFQLNGAAAGQTVFHYHMHLLPRMKGDSLQIHSRTPGDPDRLAGNAQKIAAALASLESQ
jgi:histidine triad (HIT) family protein